jgi:hypothetical protein
MVEGVLGVARGPQYRGPSIVSNIGVRTMTAHVARSAAHVLILESLGMVYAPFFGIVRRGGAMIMLKDTGVDPLPNYKREPAARWDAYLYVPDPDALAAEFASRNVGFSEPLKDTHDGLRGFELKDADG